MGLSHPAVLAESWLGFCSLVSGGLSSLRFLMVSRASCVPGILDTGSLILTASFAVTLLDGLSLWVCAGRAQGRALMRGSSYVHRCLLLVVWSCFHHGDKCQRQQLTVCESPCGVKLLPHGGQEAGREERSSQGQEPSFRGTPKPLGPISSSLLTACSVWLRFTSPSDEARALDTPLETHFQYRSFGGHIRFPGADITDGCVGSQN